MQGVVDTTEPPCQILFLMMKMILGWGGDGWNPNQYKVAGKLKNKNKIKFKKSLFLNLNFGFQDGEMFILGLLKEQRQEEVYKERFNQEWIL